MCIDLQDGNKAVSTSPTTLTAIREAVRAAKEVDPRILLAIQESQQVITVIDPATLHAIQGLRYIDLNALNHMLEDIQQEDED